MPPNLPRRTPRRRRSNDPPCVKTSNATVMSLDGVGRQVAVQLAALGVSQLQLVDHRTVSRRRQIAEGYDAEDVGRMRVHGTAQACHEINPMLEILSRSSRSCRPQDLGDVVFCNADDEQACRCLRQCDLKSVKLVVLWHVSGPLIEVSTVRDLPRGFTLRKFESAKRSRPIVPLHVASIAAGLAVDQFGRSANGRNRPQTLLLDLATLLLKARTER